MEFKTIFVALISILLLLSSTDARKRKSRKSKRNHFCANSLVRFQMTVKTMWDEDTFPKMFPIYRPPAHWSQLIGRSHGSNYRMWQGGANASFAVQRFAEDEDAEHFHSELSQGYNDVFDAFVAPDIQQSVGQTSTVLLLDGRHSKVSFMMKLVPSPDWFIGLDSVSLCYRGRWKKRLIRDLRPYDAGTQQGLTFTAPHWPNNNQDPIMGITSTLPNHPASSFFYPEYKVLPKIAQVEFEIMSEYRLRKVHKKILSVQGDHIIHVVSARKETTEKKVSAVSKDENLSKKFLSDFSEDQQHVSIPGDGVKLLSGVSSLNSQINKSKIADQLDIKDDRKKNNCQVTEWSEWSPCSKTCGFGNRHRSREAIGLSRKSGGPCPLLREQRICGSMRNCKWRHFSLMDKKPQAMFRTAKHRHVRGRRKQAKTLT